MRDGENIERRFTARELSCVNQRRYKRYEFSLTVETGQSELDTVSANTSEEVEDCMRRWGALEETAQFLRVMRSNHLGRNAKESL